MSAALLLLLIGEKWSDLETRDTLQESKVRPPTCCRAVPKGTSHTQHETPTLNAHSIRDRDLQHHQLSKVIVVRREASKETDPIANHARRDGRSCRRPFSRRNRPLLPLSRLCATDHVGQCVQQTESNSNRPACDSIRTNVEHEQVIEAHRAIEASEHDQEWSKRHERRAAPR